jgi:hypothetical protein
LIIRWRFYILPRHWFRRAGSCSPRGISYHVKISTLPSLILLLTTTPVHGRAEAGQVTPCPAAHLVRHIRISSLGSSIMIHLETVRIWGITLRRPTCTTFYQRTLLEHRSRSGPQSRVGNSRKRVPQLTNTVSNRLRVLIRV